MPDVTLQGFTLTYPGFALGPVTTQLRPGVTCLVGANGAGKSTLLRSIAGIEVPTWGGRRRGDVDLAGQRPGYLPQDAQFPPRATPQQYLEHIAWMFEVPRVRRPVVATAALEAVQLADRADSRIGVLSGGMLRRLGLAQVLVQAPDILLLDEPTAGLDPLQRVATRDAVMAIADGRTVLLSTHLVEDVAAMADRVLVLCRGRLVFDGEVASLAEHAPAGAPGATALERAVTHLMADDAAQESAAT